MAAGLLWHAGQCGINVLPTSHPVNRGGQSKGFRYEHNYWAAAAAAAAGAAAAAAVPGRGDGQQRGSPPTKST